jgi:hypothetical protein
MRIKHWLYSRLIDGGKVVIPTHRPRSTPHKHYFSASGVHLCQRLSKPQGLVRLEGLDKLKKFIHLIQSQALDLPACSSASPRACFQGISVIRTYGCLQ